MIFSGTGDQAALLLRLLLGGLGAGILYDGAAFVRNRLPRGLGWAADGLWGVCAAWICALALARGGESGLRWFGPAAMAAGGALYALGPRRLIRWAAAAMGKCRGRKG